MRSDAAKLRSIQGFTQAGVAVGELRVKEAWDEFERTQHSCYSEGWAEGFRHAMKLAEEFVRDTLAEESEKADA